MRYSFALIGLLLFAQAAGDETTTNKLIDLAPHFSLDDPSLRSMRFKGEMSLGENKWAFDVAIDRPGHSTLLLIDGRDGTPVLWLADGRFLVYDPARQHVVVSDPDHAVLGVTFKVEREKLNIDWGFNNHAGARGFIDIDLKSLSAGLTDAAVRRESERAFTLTGTSPRGNRYSAQIDTSRPCPYRRVEITGKDTSIRVTDIRRNEPIPPECWQFPALSEVKQRVPVVLWDDLSPAGAQHAMEASALSIAFRHDIEDPKLRGVWEHDFGPVDWEAARKADARISAGLRQILAAVGERPATPVRSLQR